MKAHKFVAEFGIERANAVLEGAPSEATHFLYDSELMMADYLKHMPDVSEFSFDLWCGKHWGWKPFTRTKKRIDLLELKQVVESVELIDSYGGITKAKAYMTRYFKLNGAFRKDYPKTGKFITQQMSALQNAIAHAEKQA